MLRKIGRILATAFFALTALAGISNGFMELGQAEGAFQLSVQIGDVAWGIFGLLVAIGLWRRRPWTGSMAIVWALTVTYTGSVAAAAYSEEAQMAAGLSAFVSLSVFSGLMAWYARRATRVQESAPTQVQ